MNGSVNRKVNNPMKPYLLRAPKETLLALICKLNGLKTAIKNSADDSAEFFCIEI